MLQNSLQKYRDLKEAQTNLRSSPGCSEGAENVPPSSLLIENVQPSRFPYNTPTPVSLRPLSDVPPTPTLFSIKKSLLRTPLTPLDTPRVVPQAAESNVKVVVRIRPVSNEESGEPCHLTRVERDSLLVTANGEQHAYTFDYVADQDTSQDAFFRAVGRPMVENCLAGYNSSVFAFGQTGSGKTYTMLGQISPRLDVGDESLQLGSKAYGEVWVQGGLIPRMFAYLFERIAEAEAAKRVGRELRFLCKISFLEIYQEVITDLLQPGSTRLQIREDLKRGVHVEGLSEESVSNVDEVMALVARGAAHRRVGETKMNSESSRSHCLLTCTIESKCTEGGVVAIRSARLDLVDLAGSERQKSVESEGERLKEATSINRSLSALGLVVRKLVAGEAHIPYRDSRLTFLMQDSLGGNAKTVFIATVSPAASCIKETAATLKFAQSAKELKNKAIVNEDTRGEAGLLLLENARLRKELQAFYTLQSAKTPPPSVTPVNDENVAMKAMNEELCERLTLVIEVNQTLEAQVTCLQDENARLRRERDTLDLVQQQAHAQMQLLVEAQLDARQKAAEERTPDAVREGSRKLANVETQLAKALEEITLLKDRLKREKDSSAQQLESYGRQAAETITALQSQTPSPKKNDVQSETQVDGQKQMIEALKAASSQAAIEQDAVALKLAAALQDTAAKLAAAEARDGGATAALQSVQTQLDIQIAKAESFASQAHALLHGMVVQSQDVRTLTHVLQAAKSQVHSVKEDNQRLQCLEARLIEAESKRADGEERLRSSQARLVEADQNMQRMQDEMIRQDEVLNQCRAEIQQWQAQFAHLNKEIAEKEELLRIAREHAAGAAATAAAADQYRLEMERKVSGLETTCMQRLSQIEELQSAIEDQRQEARAQRAAAAAQASSSEARERSLAQVNSLLSAMNAKVTSLRKEAESHRAQLRESHCQMAWLRGEIAEREALLKEMEATSLHALEEARRRLADEEAAHATSLHALEEDRGRLAEEEAAHATSLHALEEARGRLADEEAAHVTTARALEEVRENLEMQQTAHAASLEALDEARVDLERERAVHAASLEALDEAKADLGRERMVHAASLKALDEARADLERELAAHAVSSEALYEARADLNRERTGHAASLEALSEDRADLVRQLTAQEASLLEVTAYLDRERSAHAASLEALEEARAELRVEKAAHERTIHDLKETWAELEAEQGARASFESLWNEGRAALAEEAEKACQASAQLDEALSRHTTDQEALAQVQGNLDKEQRAHASSLDALRQARAELEREEAAHELSRRALERAEAQLVQVESSRAATVQALEEVTERLGAEGGALAASVEAQVEARTALEQERTAHAASLETLTDARAALERERAAHAISLGGLSEARADLERQQSAHAASCEAVKETSAALEREQNAHAASLETLNEARAALEQEQTAHAASLETLTEARADLGREQTAHAASLETLTEARVDLERERTANAASLEALDGAIAKLEERRCAHGSSLGELKQARSDLEDALSAHAHCAEKLREAESAHAAVVSAASQARAELDEERSGHEKCRDALAAAHGELQGEREAYAGCLGAFRHVKGQFEEEQTSHATSLQDLEDANALLVQVKAGHATSLEALEEAKARLVQVEAAHATSLQALKEAEARLATERSARAASTATLEQDVNEARLALATERSTHAAERAMLEQDAEKATARLVQAEAAHARSLEDIKEANARLATERSAHAATRATLEQDVEEARSALASERSAHAATRATLEQDVGEARSDFATERTEHAAARTRLEAADEGWSAAKRQVEALEGRVYRQRRRLLLAKSCFTSVHQAWVRGTGLLAVSAWKQQQLQEEVLRVQQCLRDTHNEASHLAAQVAGRDDHLLHLERRLTEAKSAVQAKDKQLSALLARSGETEDASRGATSALKAAEVDAMLRSLRHDAERAKAAALADQREQFEADLADAAGRERTLREERDILIGQQQQQAEQMQVMQQQLEAFRAQQAANARDISSLRAERDLALDQLTDLQDLVDAEESLLVRCTDLEAALERAQGVKEYLQQHIVSLEQDAAAEKAAADSHIADLKAEVSQVRAERDGALLSIRKPWQRRRHPKLLSLSRCKPSSVLRRVLGHRAILKQRRLKVYGRLQTPALVGHASTERLGFGLA